MDTTIYSDEQIYQVRQLAELTRSGKINWECIEYAPFSFMLGGDWGTDEPYLTQMFTLRAEHNGGTYELQLSENIDFQSEKGDIAITLERGEMAGFMKHEDALSFENERYSDCPVEKLEETFKDHVAVLFSSAVPAALDSETVKDTFEWAAYVNEDVTDKKLLSHPLFKLGEKLFHERDLLAFHRCVLDVEYRQKLLDELAG